MAGTWRPKESKSTGSKQWRPKGAEDSGGAVDTIKSGGASVLNQALRILDTPGRTVRKTIFGGSAERGVGTFLEENDIPVLGGIWGKRFVGGVGDILTDPLSYLTGGATRAAGQVGKVAPVAERAARIGSTAAAKNAVRQVGTKEVARQLVAEGNEEAATRVLSRGVNALSKEEATSLGVRQGLTWGVGTKRVAIPGTGSLVRGANKATGGVVQKAENAIVRSGRVSGPAKAADLSPVQRLKLEDADLVARNQASGWEAEWAKRFEDTATSLKNMDRTDVYNALTGRAAMTAEARQVRELIDEAADSFEKLTGRSIPRIDDYFPVRLSDEGAETLRKQGDRVGRGVGGIKSKKGLEKRRAFRPGDKYLGVKLTKGDAAERNAIAVSQGLDAIYETDPLKVVRMYLGELRGAAERELRYKALGVGSPPVTTKRGKGAGAAAKAAKREQSELDSLVADLARTREAVPEAGQRGLAALDQADELSAAGNTARAQADQAHTAIADEIGAVPTGERLQGDLAYQLPDGTVVPSTNLHAAADARLQMAGMEVRKGAKEATEKAKASAPAAAPQTAPVADVFRNQAVVLKAALDVIDESVTKARTLAAEAAAKGDTAGMQAAGERAKALIGQREQVMAKARELQQLAREQVAPKVQALESQVDHAAIAQRVESIQIEQQENLLRLEAARAKVADVAERAQTVEVIAREEAERLYQAAAVHRAAAEHELAAIAALEAQALKLEADIGKKATSIAGLRKVAESKRLVVDTRAMAERGLREFASGRYAEDWVVRSLTELDAALTPVQMSKMLKLYDKVTGHWRAMALLSPGYHERNFLGGMFNNALAGMNPKRYFDFATAHKQYKQGGIAAIKDAEVRAAFESGIKNGQYQGADIGELGALVGESGGRVVGNQNPLFRANTRMAKRVERNLRMPLYIDSYIKSGGDELVALDSVVKYHFDYDDLTRFERNIARRAMGFYTWTRKNFPLQIEQVIKNPGMYSRFIHLRENLELGVPEDEVVPEYYGELFAIRLPFTSKGNRVYGTPDLPFVGLNKATDPSSILSGLAPLPKTIIESSLGYKLFEQRPFSQTEKTAPSGGGTWRPLLEVLKRMPKVPGLPRVWTGKDGQLYMSENDVNKIESAMPLLGRLRRLFPNEEKMQDRVFTTWISFTFGLGMRTLDEATVAGEMKRRAQAAGRQKSRDKILEGS